MYTENQRGRVAGRRLQSGHGAPVCFPWSLILEKKIRHEKNSTVGYRGN